MINYCETCALADKVKNICMMFGMSIKPEEDYCSKHRVELYKCEVCGRPMATLGILEQDDTGQWHRYCEECNKLYNTCQVCPNFQKCEFQTNPDPMPKVVVKTIQQGNMRMQTQIKNEERVKKFCHTCCCWNAESGCLKDFNAGCINKPNIFA